MSALPWSGRSPETPPSWSGRSPSLQKPEGLVWPGVAGFWSPQTPVLDRDAKASFSFDWTRGRSGSKREERVPFLSGFGEGLPFASRQKWKYFGVLLSLSLFMFVLSGAFLPLVLLRPQKFCLFFTLGSMLSMASFAVLRGPLEQLKHMFSLQRLPFTSTYVASMALTLYAALVLQSYILVLLFSALQAASVAWYLLSYIPGGAPILRLLTRGCVKGIRAVCCGCGGGSGGSSSWPSLSRGASAGLLPL